MRVLTAVLAGLITIAHCTTAAAQGRASLAERLRRLLDDPPFDRALWGVAIADPTGRIIFERNGDRLFVPASNTKIVVSAVAAALLPPGYRFRTSVYAFGAVTDSTLRGDLVLYGRGDPALSDRFQPTRLSVFEEFADSVRARGIARIEGDVVGDASFFDSVTIHPSWESYDLSWWYAAPVSALAFNDNSVDFRITPTSPGAAPLISFEPDIGMVVFVNRARTVGVDLPRTIDFVRIPGTDTVWAVGNVPADARPWTENVSVRDGALYAATAFRRALESRGVLISGRARAVYDTLATAAARTTRPIAEHDSPELADLIEPILRVSHNWYAEMLLKTLGRLRRGVGSFEAGIGVERRFLLDSMRVDSSMVGVTDGSGLSHWNLMTPRAFVTVLRAIREHPRSDTFIDALPVGGRTGTLANRFRGALAGRVRAKTGSIANTNTLSGYVDSGLGTYTFSIQLNNHRAPNREALRRIDLIVAELAR